MVAMRECPNGHTWEDADDSALSAAATSRVCPYCGSPALTATQDALPPSPELLALNSALDRSAVQPLPTVPGYEIVENLGPGGMGVVFKARQLMPPRLVALKMIKDGAFASAALRSRFRREAEAVARLQHPNIVPIHEFGEHDGRPFFTMEYMEGGTLQQKLAGTPQPPTEAARLTEILARAIHAAHVQGIIHRDLKPSNILLSAGPLNECVLKIADFGLVKIVEGNTDLTPTQAVLGTVGYMPPEQASGKSATIGPTADVYSLGAIFYQMLTGRPPFHGDSTVEVLLQVMRDDPVPPRRLRSSVPVEVETICLACLEKDPVRRYSSALELAEELRRFQAHEPIKRRPLGAVYRLVRWGRRKPTLAVSAGLALSLVVVTVLAVLIVLSQGQSNRARKRQLAENFLERGQTLAQRNEHDKALLEFARGLEVLPFEETDLERVLRVNMGASHSQLHRLLAFLSEPDAIHSVAYSADGKELITTNHDGKGRIWDIATGKVRAELHHGASIRTGERSPDGATFATGSSDGTAGLWNCRTGALRFFLPHHKPNDGTVWAAGFTRDNRWVITGADDSFFRIWNARTGERVQKLSPKDPKLSDPALKVFRFARTHDGKHIATAHGNTVVFWELGDNANPATEIDPPLKPLGNDSKGEIFGLSFSPDGRFLLTVAISSEKKHIAQLWNWPARKPHNQPIERSDYIRTPTFSPDGKRFLLGFNEGEIGCFNTKDGERLFFLKGAQTARFHPSGRFILGAHWDGFVRLWDSGTGRQLGAAMSFIGASEGIAFHPNDETMLAIAAHRSLPLWRLDFQPGGEFRILLDQNVRSVDFHPDGRCFVVALDGKLQVHDIGNASPRLMKSFDAERHEKARFIGDGSSMVTTGLHTHSIVWDLIGDQPKKKHDIEHVCTTNAVSPDRKLFAGVEGNRVLVWDLDKRGLMREWQDDEAIAQVAFVTSQILATGSEKGKVKLWDLPSGAFRSLLVEHPNGVAVSPLAASGNLLAIGFGDQTVHVYQWATGQRHGDPLAHGGSAHALAFTDDGKALVVGSRALTLWDLATRRRLMPPLLSEGDVVGLSVAPDGRSLLVGCAHANRGVHQFALPVAVKVPSQQAVLWSEVVTGLKADERGDALRLMPEEWQRRRDELRASGVVLEH